MGSTVFRLKEDGTYEALSPAEAAEAMGYEYDPEPDLVRGGLACRLDKPKLVTVRQAGAFFGIHKSSMQRWRRKLMIFPDRAMRRVCKVDYYEVGDLERAQRLDPPKPRFPSDKQNTYFIRCTGTGRIKIGRAQRVEYRLAAIKHMCPYPLECLGILRGDHEAKLHQRFKENRLHGEWFEPSPELLAFIFDNATAFNAKT